MEFKIQKLERAEVSGHMELREGLDCGCGPWKWHDAVQDTSTRAKYKNARAWNGGAKFYLYSKYDWPQIFPSHWIYLSLRVSTGYITSMNRRRRIARMK